MQTLTLLPEGDPFLKLPVEGFVFGGEAIYQYPPERLAELALVTMREHNAIGLSANQCGIPLRFFVMDVEGERVCFNPEILDMMGEPDKGREGCLSFPGLVLQVTRHPEIRVRYQNVGGQSEEHVLTGLEARCFAHELDHLNGITFDDRVSRLSLAMAKKKREKHGW